MTKIRIRIKELSEQGKLLLNGVWVKKKEKKKKKKKGKITIFFKRFWEVFGHFGNKLAFLGSLFHVCNKCHLDILGNGCEIVTSAFAGMAQAGGHSED